MNIHVGSLVRVKGIIITDKYNGETLPDKLTFKGKIYRVLNISNVKDNSGWNIKLLDNAYMWNINELCFIYNLYRLVEE